MADGKRFDFVCVGSATQDVFVRSDGAHLLTLSGHEGEERWMCFDYPAKVGVEHIEFTTGGGATNAGVSLARLGARAAFVGKIGTDPVGELVIRELEAQGVDTGHYLTSEEEHTGYSVILTSYEGDRTVLVHRGASTHLSPDEIDWSVIEQAGWLYVTSLSGDSAGLLGPLMARAAEAGIRVALNPGSTQIRAGLEGLREILASVEILLLNKGEAAQLTEKEPVKDVIVEARCTRCGRCVDICPGKVFVRHGEELVQADPARCLQCGKCVEECPEDAIVMEPWTFNASEAFQRLCAAGPKMVVITDGSNGSQVCDGETLWLLPAKEVPVASTLGAGDAFGSAFVFEYNRTGDPGRALGLGTANAASVIQVVGAKNGLLSAEEAEKARAEFDRDQVRRHKLAAILEAVRA
jgi:sugar/nucleoside kinase (ribokinase family)